MSLLSLSKFLKDNRQAQFVVLLFTPNDTRNHAITKELKKSPSALLSYLSTREVLKTREWCGEA